MRYLHRKHFNELEGYCIYRCNKIIKEHTQVQIWYYRGEFKGYSYIIKVMRKTKPDNYGRVPYYEVYKVLKKSILDKLNESKQLVKEADAIVDEELIDLPSLVPLLSGKYEYQLYQALCRYGSRLHYEKLLQFEYLYRAAKIYNKNSEEKVLPKKLLKLTHKAFDYISQQTQDNPDGFKQKLEKEELRRLRIKHGATVLQKSNKRKRDTNTIKVEEAIATNKYYKADGITVNVTAIANATGLSRPTVTAILKAS